jgi:hypothetical protein
VRTIQEVAVDNGVETGIVGKFGRAPRIPARAVALFRVHEKDCKGLRA